MKCKIGNGPYGDGLHDFTSAWSGGQITSASLCPICQDKILAYWPLDNVHKQASPEREDPLFRRMVLVLVVSRYIAKPATHTKS